jgi:hypothetical protein
MPEAGGSSTLSTASTDASGTAKRQLTLNVWHYLDALCKDVRSRLVRYGAHCKICRKELCGKSSSGTSQLIRHVKSCLCKQQAATSSNQTSLQFTPDGRMAHFEYNPAESASSPPCWFCRIDGQQ